MPPTSAPSSPSQNASNVFLDVFPLGLALAGVLTASRALLTGFGSAPGLDEEAIGFRVLALAERWPALLAEALIAGVVGALVLTYAYSARPRGLASFVAIVVSFLATAAFLTGFPDPLPGISAGTVGAAVGATLIAFGLSRLPFRGPVALVVGLLVGFGLPFGFASYIKKTSPGMPSRQVLLDVVAKAKANADGFLEVVTQRSDAPVGVGVIAPIVDQFLDTGDKPSLVMIPPASVEFVVPLDAEGATLFAAAGMDRTSTETMAMGGSGAERAAIPVRYTVTVDGRQRWDETIQHSNVGPGWTVDHMQWRHVSEAGEDGIVVRAGQKIRLSTSLGEGAPPADSLEPSQLRVGFGNVSLVRVDREPRRVATPHSPNVVFIVIDTQRRDRLGCYGYDRPVSPNIDALASSGTIYDEAYTTSSWTWPSTASLMTSWLPDAHGVKGHRACTLDQSLVTLAEELQGRGYTTAAFLGNPIVSRDKFFDQGFEVFDNDKLKFRMSDKFIPEALEWMEKHAPLRFFMYLHLADPHTPHEPAGEQIARLGLGPAPAGWPEGGFDGLKANGAYSPEVRAYASDLYDASVATCDMWVGRILDKIDELSLDDRTIICLTTDHGEEILDRGFRGHGHTVFPELVRAPLILRGPGIPVGRRSGVVSNRHVPTTLAALCGAALPTQGLPVHLLDDTLPDEALFETSKGEWGVDRTQELFGIRRGANTTHWRLGGLGHERLGMDPKDVAKSDLRQFDAVADPRAERDLISIAQDMARDGAARIKELVVEARGVQPRGITGAGAGSFAVLKAIGYMGDDGDDSDVDLEDEDDAK